MEEIKKISGEVWLVFKAYYEKQKSDTDWKKLIDSMNEVIEKYKSTVYAPFTQELCNVYMNEIEREYKRGL